MTRDIISELIIGIKNAGKAGKESVKLPYSNFKLAVAEVLKAEGFIESFTKIGKAPKRRAKKMSRTKPKTLENSVINPTIPVERNIVFVSLISLDCCIEFNIN